MYSAQKGVGSADGQRFRLSIFVWTVVALVVAVAPSDFADSGLLVASARADVVGEPRLVADINPTENTEHGSTRDLTAVGEILCFVGADGVHGEELWCSDGTEAGTTMVKDVRPGPESSEPYWLTDVGGTLFFVAGDGVHGVELWRSDGTEAGTVMVKDIRPDAVEGIFGLFNAPESLTDVNGTLFFVAGDPAHGRELWRSDGTEAGTKLVKDIYPGATRSWPGSLTDVNGILYFAADNGLHGNELWRSDGTEGGTKMIKDIHPGETDRYPGPANSNPAGLVDVGGALFFVATEEPVYGHELWRSDGTEAGTKMVRDIAPGAQSGGPAWLTDVGGRLSFTANDPLDGDEELWRSDGTEAGTQMVVGPGWGDSTLGPFADIGGTLFFASGRIGGVGALWRSDGTALGTKMVRGFDAEAHLDSFTDVNGTLFFVAKDLVHGRELWRSDGTELGTEMVGDVYPGASSYPFPVYLTVVGSTLFFVASDGVHGYDALWALETDEPPSAIDDEASLTENAPATAIDVLANDTNPDGGSKAIDSVTQPAHGTVAITGEGAGLTYLPDPDYCNAPPGAETDDFEYTLAPGGSSAKVTVTVTCVIDRPRHGWRPGHPHMGHPCHRNRPHHGFRGHRRHSWHASHRRRSLTGRSRLRRNAGRRHRCHGHRDHRHR